MDKLQFLDVDSGTGPVKIAVNARSGQGSALVWLGGFMSDMTSTKAGAIDTWAAAHGRPSVRFDYSGHGCSGGAFKDGTISSWLDQSIRIIETFAGTRPILIGSSMGGWIALLAALKLKASGSLSSPGGIVLIAPAVDFTETLMWDAFPPEIKRQIETTGLWERPSAYSDAPYPITRTLIEDGRRHLLFGKSIETGCPVHILQGAQDVDVPMAHALTLLEHLPHDPVSVTIVPDGDHRLAREADIAKLVAIVAAMPAA